MLRSKWLMIFSFIVMVLGIGTQASAGQFPGIYTDGGGLRWSKKLSTLYTNGCVDPQGKSGGIVMGDGSICSLNIKDSAAEQACAAIGGRLPTWKEYNGLVKSFGPSEYSVDQWADYIPNEAGWTDLQKVFGPIDEMDVFWTADIDTSSSDPTSFWAHQAIVFSRDGEMSGGTFYRDSPLAVLCVGH